VVVAYGTHSSGVQGIKTSGSYAKGVHACSTAVIAANRQGCHGVPGVLSGPNEACENLTKSPWCFNRHRTTAQPWLTKNKNDRMQQIIKMPDQIFHFLVPENSSCLWVRVAMQCLQKISIQKITLSFFSKINVQKIHRKHLIESMF
jgi:hypothetical protein